MFSKLFNGAYLLSEQFIDELKLCVLPRWLQIVANSTSMDNTKENRLPQSHKTCQW
ncbi:hypothetical protein [Celerinatantimonas diazotrophica]|uniref:hypothetical protein n=1 Tax=Celerinatantimonas diazotrophica TaxID=412034 RepID=UPI001404D20B|nr:hypothetical protein [Celerinatantimonas diazotrophica]